MSCKKGLRQFRSVEFLPVVEVVQVDRVGGFAVREAYFGKDGLPGFIGVLVADDCDVELGYVGLIKFRSVVCDEFFKFNIGRLFRRNEFHERIAVDPEGVEHHHVVAGTAVRVTVCELVGCAEGHFLPKAGEVKDSEWAGSSGGNSGNDFVAHGGGRIGPVSSISTDIELIFSMPRIVPVAVAKESVSMPRLCSMLR